MASRFLILVFALLPAVVQAQPLDLPLWGLPEFVQPVTVGEVLTGLRLGYCQYGILRVTPATDGMLQVRMALNPPGAISEEIFVRFAEKYFAPGWEGTSILTATHIVAAGRTTEIAVGFGSYLGADWCSSRAGPPQPFTVEISMFRSAWCEYAVSRTYVRVPADGGQGSVDVGTPYPGCPWSARIVHPDGNVNVFDTSSGSFKVVEPGRFSLLGTFGRVWGPGVVTFEAPANSSTQPRADFLDIAGHLVFLEQDGMDEDGDRDGLPTPWEVQFGLNPDVGSGADGADGDPDGDGKSNREELLAETHPRGLFTRYFAEGVTSDFFDLRAAFLNPNPTVARVLVHFQTTAGTTEHYALAVPPTANRTLIPKMLPRMNEAAFSMVIESDQPVVADRRVTWDARSHPYGSHAETSIASPATTWYLAEGATHSGFNLFYLVQNPNDVAVDVHVKYLLPSGAPIGKNYVVDARSRFNVWVNTDSRLRDTDVSAVITTSLPTTVERTMYLSSPGTLFSAGHESAAVTAPATQWFLAEGATGPFFDLYVLVANAGDADAEVEATYLLPDGAEVKKLYTIAAGRRRSIHVDGEDAKLANTAVSTTMRSLNGVPVVVERAMWWPDGAWHEGHNSPGATTTGTAWALAEGEVGGAQGVETYILVANTSDTTGAVKVTLLFEDGTSIDKIFTATARSRFNVDVRHEFPAAVNKRFGALIESQGPTPAQLVVERSVYWNAVGQLWAAGTNALATRLQ